MNIMEQSGLFKCIEKSASAEDLHSYVLLKFFSKKKYAEQFMAGSLYMNSLSYFWENGFEKQQDILEGVNATLRKESILSGAKSQIFKGDLMFRLDAYKYCNLLCFYRMDFSNQFQIDAGIKQRLISIPPSSMTQFGGYVVIIKQPQSLISRFSKQIPTGAKFVTGDVTYKPITGLKPGEKTQIVFQTEKQMKMPAVEVTSQKDCFVKESKYADQREWRICLFRGEKETNAHIANVGDLSDIATLVPVKKLKSTILDMYGPFLRWYPEVRPLYQGNMRRREFKEYLHSFEEGLGDLILLA